MFVGLRRFECMLGFDLYIDFALVLSEVGLIGRFLDKIFNRKSLGEWLGKFWVPRLGYLLSFSHLIRKVWENGWKKFGSLDWVICCLVTFF